MPAELQPTAPRTPSRDSASHALIERGADLVYLAEELYLRLFILTLLLTMIGCAISIWFAVIGSHTSLALTTLIAILTFALATIGLARPRRCYRWLRYSRLRQLSPALIGSSPCSAMALTAPRGGSRFRCCGWSPPSARPACRSRRRL